MDKQTPTQTKARTKIIIEKLILSAIALFIGFTIAFKLYEWLW